MFGKETFDCLVVFESPLHSGREAITGLHTPRPKRFWPTPPATGPTKLVVVK